MASVYRALSSAFLFLLITSRLWAQPSNAPLPIHSIRSGAPTDSSFEDLAFLRAEIGNARVVMLGEPTHGEGNVTEAKIRLMKFLQQRMGFTTVAFESSFYELDKAQQALEAGKPVREVVRSSVYPVWSETQEFQAILPLLGKGGLRVAGFDSQLGGHQDELLEELEAFLKPEKGSGDIAYDYVDECLATMGEVFIFPPSHQILLFDRQVGKARKLLEKVAAGSDAKRRERAEFWLQNLRSIQALAHDYATNDPADKDSASFKAADSNPRDAQMADNLLWYLRKHPREKVICWGALPHLAARTELLQDAELREYKPMGRAVKAALGPDAVYVLGTLAGGGTYGFGYWGKHKQVPTPAAGTLEAELLAQGHDYSFVSLKRAAPGRQLTTYAFEYAPITGPWSEVVDGFLFLKTVNPPHAVVPETGATAQEIAPVAVPILEATHPGRPNPAARPMVRSGSQVALSGIVLDRKTNQPVPFATVAVPARSAGTIADAQGRFQLNVGRGEVVQISSIGYEAATMLAEATGTQTVRLVPAAFALAAVRVSAQSQDPKRIMKKVIQAIATNYERQDYQQEAYSHRRITSFDTLRHEVEYVSQEFVPAGYHNWAGGFLSLEPRPVTKVEHKHVLAPTTEPTSFGMYLEGGHGFSGGFDPVRISPLFKAGTLGKYQLWLDTLEQHGGETYYVIRFAVKRASHRATGMYQTSGYSGRLYVRQQNYAVVRYEALWQNDTTEHNAIAHKYYGRGNNLSRLYRQVYTDHRTAHIVTYQQAPTGRYYAATSVAQASSVGRVLGGAPFHNQKTYDIYYAPPTTIAAARMPDPKTNVEVQGGPLWQLSKVAYRPEFWQTYQRLIPAQTPPN